MIRLSIIREEIGWDNLLMVDANQIWDVNQAIEWMKELADFKPLWIEEPTSKRTHILPKFLIFCFLISKQVRTIFWVTRLSLRQVLIVFLI
jgi:hypothetical protein